METIYVKNTLPVKGHYSPAIRDGDLLYISGQLPINQLTGEHCGGDIQDQAKQIFENFNNLLIAAGTQKNQVLKVVIYITDIQEWDLVNAAYEIFFGDHYPARSIVPVKPLHYGFKMEMEGIAKIPQEDCK